MDNCCIVLNPEARASRKLGIASQIATIAPGAAVRLTKGPGHAAELARQAVAEGFHTVVAGGGDGTVNEVLSGVAGSNARLGVLPLGTMNVFARELALPLEWTAAWSRITRGGERRVDLGWANGVPFAQLAGVGFDAQALTRVNPAFKRFLGPPAYVFAGLQVLSQRLPQLNISAEGMAPMQGVWVVLGTGRYYGGPFPVFPNAKNGDGLLNVLVIRDLNLKCLLSGLLTLPFGWHPKLPEVTYFRTKRLRVEMHLEGAEISGLELDGELRGHAPVDFQMTPGALRVAV